MKIIAPTNNKGGVGKTKVSILLAEYFALIQKKKVLGIDFDPQCNFSSHFLQMERDPSSPEGLMPPIHPDVEFDNPDYIHWPDGRSSIADIFYGRPVLPYSTYINNLDIAPAYASQLQDAEAVRKNEVMEKVHKQLRLFLDLPEVQESYDVVIIDTPPSKGPLTVSVIKAATHIIIPTVMEEKPIQGVYGMLQLWKQESYMRGSSSLPQLELIGILANMYQKTTLHEQMYLSLLNNDALSKFVLKEKLGRRTIFAEVDSENSKPRSIFEYPDANLAKQEALSVCEIIYKRAFNNG